MKNFNWETGLFIIIYHVALILGLPFYFIYCSPSLALLLTSAALVFVTGCSITACYHRKLSHSAYKTNRIVEGILLFFATMAAQGSALRWSFDHRLHHAHVDTDKDPYSINKGFWYAHILWLFEKPQEIDPKVVADLMRNPLIMFQHKYYGILFFLTNTMLFLTVGYFFEDYFGAFVLAWWTRLLALHHCTWFINSLAHYWGSRSFSKEHSAVDNYIISLLTFGEGYHNYHHTFASDYRNGIKWYHFDPTKWLIWTLSFFGLATGLKRVTQPRIHQRMVLEVKDKLLEKIRTSIHHQKEQLEEVVSKVTDELLTKLKDAHLLIEKYHSFKQNKEMSKEFLKDLSNEIKTVNRTLKTDWKKWKAFSKSIIEHEAPEGLSL